MITQVYVDNFKCLANFQLLLKPLTLLLGANGSGKSTVFDVLQRMRSLLVDGTKVGAVFPPETLTRWQQDRSSQIIELRGQGAYGAYAYSLTIDHLPERKLSRVSHETLLNNDKPLFSFDLGEVQLYRDDYSEGPQYPFDWSQSALHTIAPRSDNRRLTAFRDEAERCLFCSPDPRHMASEAPSENATLEINAVNFASWYRFFAQESPDRIAQLNQVLSEVLPGFQVLPLLKTGIEARTLYARYGNTEQSSKPVEYKFDEISDGERMLILLYSLDTLAAGAGHTLILDEPDNFVGLRELQPWLMHLQEMCETGAAQAILISHHPEIIDYLGKDCGIWLDRLPNGPTRVVEAPKTEDVGLKLSELIARGWE